MILGLILIIAAAVLQGVFLLPMSRSREWAWEHMWLAFSLTGMVVCNWFLALILLPAPWAIYAGVPIKEITILAVFGIAWGVGAVLFGLGMDMLGLTLGYPLIMGVNASVGTFVPLLWLYGRSMFSGGRLFIAIGTLLAIMGIVICSLAGAMRESAARKPKGAARSRFIPGLIISLASGILSCLPNIGLTYGAGTIQSARHLGASQALAGNAVWCLFFTFGALVNIIYCGWLMLRKMNLGKLFDVRCATNWLWALAMGVLWIGAFYLYGIGTVRMGAEGSSVGWPILVSLSIGVGVLCGLGKGEWRGAPLRSRNLLWGGLGLILLAILIIPSGTATH
jgi:L-rhamnose-H+ transport protein